MRTWTRVLCALVVAAMILPAFGQDAPSATERDEMKARLDRLQQQIEALAREAAELRARLEGTTPPAEDDLLAVDTVQPPAVAAPQDTTTPEAAPAAEALPAEVVNNPAPVAGNAFNPDISVIGNFLGHAGTDNPFEPREAFDFEEAEIGLEAFVDPYARAKFFIGITPEGAELEEGYAQFITLPWDLTAKAGKMKEAFGKANTWHTHVRPWVDQPLVIRNFFGEEGLAASGVSATKIIPTNDAFYMDATAEVFSGNAYNAHLKFFRDLTESTNLEVGTSYARDTSNGVSRFAGVDVSYRWKPLVTATRKGFIGRLEVIRGDRDDRDDAALGFYTSLDYQFAQRWITGLRVDRADRPLEPGNTDRGLSLSLTFRPSEFSQLRGQIRRTRYAHELEATELLLQLQFSIGAHGAHTF